eukprot:1805369-Pyramimonas_sp.AAC.2
MGRAVTTRTTLQCGLRARRTHTSSTQPPCSTAGSGPLGTQLGSGGPGWRPLTWPSKTCASIWSRWGANDRRASLRGGC